MANLHAFQHLGPKLPKFMSCLVQHQSIYNFVLCSRNVTPVSAADPAMLGRNSPCI